MSTTTLTPRAGTIEDIRREDDCKGYERDETDQFHQLVGRLVAAGDTRAKSAGRRQARRTLAEMAPGYDRQPVLRMNRPLTFRSANDACGLCNRWNCGGFDCPPGATASASVESNQLQCDRCQGWFGYTGWTCPACLAVGAQMALPMRPTPHERDGRTEPSPAPARPHSALPEGHQP
ncbi:hypothetical protein ABT001_32595 [Streptomyces sp. NPDC002793]|uniref:hypothetical protein n=1 Tax=Streptomyces sp. NPDC002793 TaxID=3154432 RepID=UPI00332EF91C